MNWCVFKQAKKKKDPCLDLYAASSLTLESLQPAESELLTGTARDIYDIARYCVFPYLSGVRMNCTVAESPHRPSRCRVRYVRLLHPCEESEVNASAIFLHCLTAYLALCTEAMNATASENFNRVMVFGRSYVDKVAEER